MENRHNTRSHKPSGLAAAVRDSDDAFVRTNEKDKIDENDQESALRKTLSDADVNVEDVPKSELEDILKAINISKADQSFTSQKSDEDDDVVPSSQFPELKSQTPGTSGNRSLRKSPSPEYDFAHTVKTTPSTSAVVNNRNSQASNLFDRMIAEAKNTKDSRYLMSPSPDRKGHTVRLTQYKPEIKPTPMSLGIETTPRWMIDPFECYHPSASSHYPIKPAIVSTQRPQFKVVDDEIIIPEKLVAERAAMLVQQANQWIQLVHDRSNKKFSWGTPSAPIKIGTTRNNGSRLRSTDMEMPIDDADEADEDSIFDTKTRMIPREPGSRQMMQKLLPKKSDVFDFDDPDDDDNFDPQNPNAKKKKGKGRGKNSAPKNPAPKRPGAKKNAKKVAPESDENQTSMNDFIDDSDVQPNSRKRSISPEYEAPPQKKKQATGRGKTLGPRSRVAALPVTRAGKIVAAAVLDVEVTPGRQRGGLNEVEIVSSLMTDDESESEEKPTVKQLPSKRLETGTSFLGRMKAQESEFALVKQQEREILAAQKAEKSAELANQRLIANKSLQAAKERAEMQQREKEEQYRNFSIGSQGPCSSTRQRTELMPDTPQRKGAILLTEEEVLNAHRAQSMKVQGKAVEKVPCPLCGKLFTQKQIHEHANNCCDSMEIPVVNANINKRTSANSEDLHCAVCNNFVAETRIILNRHKKECVTRMTGEDWEL